MQPVPPATQLFISLSNAVEAAAGVPLSEADRKFLTPHVASVAKLLERARVPRPRVAPEDLTGAEVVEAIRKQAQVVIDQYKALTADGKLSVADTVQLASAGVVSLMHVVEFAAANAAELWKKDLVLELFDSFFDQVIAPLDIPMVPAFLEATLVDPALKALLRQVASGLIDTLTQVLNKTGWGEPPAVTPGTPTAPGPFTPY